MNIFIVVLIMSGWGSQYSQRVMERVIAVQQKWGHLPQNIEGYDGYVAVADCHRIGQTLWARPEGTEKWERFLITDCAGSPETVLWMRNVPIEVDHLTAKRWNTVGKGIRVEIGRRIRQRRME